MFKKVIGLVLIVLGIFILISAPRFTGFAVFDNSSVKFGVQVIGLVFLIGGIFILVSTKDSPEAEDLEHKVRSYRRYLEKKENRSIGYEEAEVLYYKSIGKSYARAEGEGVIKRSPGEGKDRRPYAHIDETYSIIANLGEYERKIDKQTNPKEKLNMLKDIYLRGVINSAEMADKLNSQIGELTGLRYATDVRFTVQTKKYGRLSLGLSRDADLAYAIMGRVIANNPKYEKDCELHISRLESTKHHLEKVREKKAEMKKK